MSTSNNLVTKLVTNLEAKRILSACKATPLRTAPQSIEDVRQVQETSNLVCSPHFQGRRQANQRAVEHGNGRLAWKLCTPAIDNFSFPAATVSLPISASKRRFDQK